MHFGFSYIGLIFLILLMAPNLAWTNHQPKDYEKYVVNENKVLLGFERAGEVLVTCLALIFSDFNVGVIRPWSLWLLAACVLMVLYEAYWIRYFRSSQTMVDFYSSLLGVPVAGATLPVLAFFCLAVYGRNPFLLAAVVILGIGHIGIHLGHRKELAGILEVWDAYLEDGTLAGRDLVRGEEIPDGLYHLVGEVVVKHEDGTYLFMQRDWRKSLYPGYFEMSAGGAALKGEDPMTAAKRELREETGIEAGKLMPIYVYRAKNTIYHGFLCITNWEKWNLDLQEEESIAYQWLNRKEALAILASDQMVPGCRERVLPHWEIIENRE